MNAVVTGASRGIGEAIALKLADMGYDLTLVARDAEKLAAVRKACVSRGVAATVCAMDLTSEDAIVRLFSERGEVDLLVNNAGIGIFDPLVDARLEDWRKIFQLNVEGAFLCVREALKCMAEKKRGRIINIASVVGVKGYPQQGAYGASKHALLGMTKTAIEEGREFNIRVHAICPGGVATEMLKQSRPDLTDFSAMIQPEDIADAVAYLCGLPENITVDVIHLRRAASDQSW